MPKCKNDESRNYKGDEPSPKGLGYCAHAEKVGKIMEGRNGYNWVVKETKKGSKRWVNDDGVIFVFYTMDKGGTWSYKKKFPKHWNWTGGGGTNPFTKNGMSHSYKYEKEEQFNGSLTNRDEMKKYLSKYFDKLKKDKIIKYYKIKYAYRPE